jgi:hypothetical protein
MWTTVMKGTHMKQVTTSAYLAMARVIIPAHMGVGIL